MRRARHPPASHWASPLPADSAREFPALAVVTEVPYATFSSYTLTCRAHRSGAWPVPEARDVETNELPRKPSGGSPAGLAAQARAGPEPLV